MSTKDRGEALREMFTGERRVTGQAQGLLSLQEDTRRCRDVLLVVLCTHCSYSDGSRTTPVRRRYALYLQCRYAVNTSSVIFMLTMSLRLSEPYSVIACTLACACTHGGSHLPVLAH